MAESSDRQKKKWFQFTSNPLITSLILILLLLCPAPAWAQCTQDFGAGEAFYNFKKIIIKYTLFPSKSEQGKAGFPAELSEKNFSDRLIKIIKKNFSECLQDKQAEIPIVTSAYSDPLYDNADIYKDENLSLIVRVSFGLNWRGPQGIKYGTITYFWYRPGAKYKNARIPLTNNSGTLVFFPDHADKPLNKQLDEFLSAVIKPASTSTGPSYVVIERK